MFKVENLSPIFVRVILDQNIKFLQYIFTTSFVFTDKNKKEKYENGNFRATRNEAMC